MSEELFDVVFFGILQAGKEKEAVMQNMAALFKTDAAKLAPYFAGGRKVIKGKINSVAAEKYKVALENVGLVIKLEPVTTAADNTDTNSSTAQITETDINTNGITVAPVGSDVIENPVQISAQKIDDISSLTMAEAGADVIENPVEATPQKIADVSDISMAEVGSNVLEHPPEVVAQKIEELPDLSLAETGADMIENPKPAEKAKIPETSELSLDDETG